MVWLCQGDRDIGRLVKDEYDNSFDEVVTNRRQRRLFETTTMMTPSTLALDPAQKLGERPICVHLLVAEAWGGEEGKDFLRIWRV